MDLNCGECFSVKLFLDFHKSIDLFNQKGPIMSKRTRIMIILKILSLIGNNHAKARVLKKSGIFEKFGNDCYWQPDWIPSFPDCIRIGNNVTVAADARLYEHDIIHRMWNEDAHYIGERIGMKKEGIVIEDNTVICARSIILCGVTIGKNVVVACGSVVTKDIPDFSIVAGNPARVIGDSRELFKRRICESGFDMNGYEYVKYFDRRS